MAYNEIDKLQEGHKPISDVERNRIALKFLDMNQSPSKYSHYLRYTEDHVKEVKLNLDQKSLRLFSKLKRKT